MGLMAGKPMGVLLFCWLATVMGWCRLPPDLRWSHIAGAGMLGGIGFTMSIFITNLAFATSEDLVNASKIAILLASLLSGIVGLVWLRCVGRRVHFEN
jgi:NhaA family Na+:H+ antiporter